MPVDGISRSVFWEQVTIGGSLKERAGQCEPLYHLTVTVTIGPDRNRTLKLNRRASQQWALCAISPSYDPRMRCCERWMRLCCSQAPRGSRTTWSHQALCCVATTRGHLAVLHAFLETISCRSRLITACAGTSGEKANQQQQ